MRPISTPFLTKGESMTTLRTMLIAGALFLLSTPLGALTARITLSDGSIRTATLEGVGCSTSICSRVVIKGKAGGIPITTRLDSIAAIQDVTANSALLVLKDGTTRRLTLVNDFRIIYLANRSDGGRKEEKLDLARARSVEFIPTPR